MKRLSEIEARHTSEPVDFNDSDLLIVFSPSDLQAIAKRGFLNAHEVKKTSWDEDNSGISLDNYLALRKNVEDRMLGREIKDPSLRPKYGLVQVYDHNFLRFFADEGFLSGDREGSGIDMYGSVAAVMKSDVKKRTTFTLFDSLQEFAPSGGNRDAALTRKTRSNLRTFSDSPVGVDADVAHGVYVEAQIWGPLSLDDISHFAIDRHQFRSEALLKKTFEQLQSFGKPIFLSISEKTPLSQAFPRMPIEKYSSPDSAKNPLSDLGYWLPGERLNP